MTDVSEADLAQWLQPAGVGLEGDRIRSYHALVGAAATDAGGHEYELVRLAHQLEDAAGREWLAGKLAELDPALTLGDKNALVAHLACATILQMLRGGAAADSALINLLVENAAFLNLKAATPGLHDESRASLKRAGARIRRRDAIPSAKAPSLPKKREPSDEEPLDVDDLASDLGDHATGIRQLAQTVTDMSSAIRQITSVADEELEILWWSLLGSNDDGVPWDHLAPSQRSIDAAMELARRTAMVPGPPAADAFIHRALGSEAGSNVTIAEFALALAAVEHSPVSQSGLLPLSATVAMIRDVGAEERDLWEGLATKKHGVATDLRITLAHAGGQLYRELLILNYFGE